MPVKLSVYETRRGGHRGKEAKEDVEFNHKLGTAAGKCPC